MADDVKLGIGARLEASFAAALEEAKVQSKEATAEIKESFEGMSEAFEKVQGAILLFTAVLAGGEAFKEMIASTVNAAKESASLGRQLGISTSSASQLRVAMDDVYLTQEQVSGANQKVTMALKKNESAFSDLGVATRDSNGHLRNSFDILQDTNEKLSQFKEGTDRNVEGVKIYGKAWVDMQQTLRLTKEVVEEARVKADALGLTVGTKSVAETARYRAAMNEMHDVMEAVGKVIAETVMPILSSLGEWFGQHGPQVVAVFRAAIFSLEAVWIEFKGVIVNWVDSLAGSLDIAMAYLERFKDVTTAALTPGASIKAAWEKGTANIVAVTKAALAIVADDAEKTKKALADAMEGLAADTTKTPEKDGGETSEGGDEKKQRLMANLAAELEAQKSAWSVLHAAHGDFVQFSLEQERAFWTEKTGLAKAGSADAVAIQKNIDKLTVDIEKAAYTDSIAVLKEKEAAYKNNLTAKLAIAKEMEAKISQAEEGKGPAVRAAGAEVLSIEREIKEQRLAIDDAYIKAATALELSKIDAAEREANLQYQLASISNEQLIGLEQSFEAARYQVKLQALNKKRTLLLSDPDGNPAKLQAVDNEKLAIETTYETKVDQLRIKAVENNNKIWKSMFATMQSGFSSTIQNFMKGTATLGTTIKGLFTDVGNAVIETLSNIAAKMLANAVQAIALGKLQKLEEQNANAVKAGSAAWASAANIPYVGWILAPAAGAAAYAGVMAMAKSGYDIPSNINPIVQTHASEMILPAKHADVIRSLADGGSGGKGSSFSPTISVSAMDGPSFVKWMNQNAGPVAASLRQMNNRFMATR